MTRFSETEKWRDPWFRSLKPSAKLLFLFIVDNCNNAGFWEEDMDYACYATGMNKEQYEGAIKALGRGLEGASGWFWVKRFLKHQKNMNLNPDNRAHTQIIHLIKDQTERFSELESFQQFLAPYKGLLSPTGIGKGNVKDGEVQERKGKKPPLPDIPISLNTAEFREAWGSWVQHRKEKNEPLTATSVQRQFKTMETWGIPRSIAAIHHTIEKGWIGLQEPEPPKKGQNGFNGHHRKTEMTLPPAPQRPADV